MMEKPKEEGKVRNIQEWLRIYAKFSQRLFTSGRTLDDQHNPLFMLGKEEELQSSVKAEDEKDHIFEKTGFICPSVTWSDDAYNTSKENDSVYTQDVKFGKFSFLSDWERLWNYFDSEDSDEIAVQLPFLRTAIEFIFHPHIVCLVYALFAWNIIVLIILQAMYSKFVTSNIFQSMGLNSGFEIVVYMLLCTMMNGPESIIFAVKKSNYNVQELPAGKKQRSQNESVDSSVNQNDNTSESQHITLKYQADTFWATLKVFGASLIQEFRSMLFGKNKNHEKNFRKMSPSDLENNTATNTTNNRIQSGRYVLGKKTDKRRSLFYYRWVNMALKVLTRDYGVNIANINFKRQSYRYLMLFTFIGYPLYVIIMYYIKIFSLISDFCGFNDHDQEVCHFYYIQFFISGFGFTNMAGQYFYGASVLLSLVGLAYGGEIVFRLSECWTQKFHSLRRIEVVNQDVKKTNSTGNVNNATKRMLNSSSSINIQENTSEMIDIITRDATEHYFFICALLRRAGDLWSPVLLMLFFLAVYIALSNSLIIMNVARTSSTMGTTQWYIALIIYIVVRCLILAVYPILSISVANTYFIKMYDAFQIADIEDYEMIGGRDHWLEIFSFAPAAWTFFGLAITPARLFALLWTGLVALGGVLISTIISNAT